MSIDKTISRLQTFLASADSDDVNPEQAAIDLDACYVWLNSKTLFKRGSRAPNLNMDFAEA